MQDNRIGIFIEHTCVLACISCGHALAVYRNDHRNFRILLAHNKVFCAKARCRVYTAGTGFQRNVVADDNQRLAIHQRMLRGHILQLRAHDGAQNLIRFNLCSSDDRRNQVGCQHVNLAVRYLYKGILKARIQRNCQVARQCPRSRRPNHEVYVFCCADDRADLALIVLDCELDVDGRTLVVLVLNFSLSQSGLIVRAPVYRLHAAVNIALLCHLAKDGDLLCNKIVGQRQIRVIPVTDNAQTLKLGSLGVYVLQCELLALVAEVLVADLMSVQTKSGNCLTLDRQTVGVPARHIRRLEACHILVTHDEVLEDLVQCVTQMQIAVCIRRAIVENKERLALVFLHHCMVNILFLPLLQKFRLALWKTRAHRKIGLRKIDCLVVILRHVTVPSFLILDAVLFFESAPSRRFGGILS